MSEQASSSSDPSLASLLGSLINDTKDLLLQEFRMAKLEIQDELRKTKTAAIAFAIGAGVVMVGGLLLILMLVYVLAAFTTIPVWGCFGIIAVVLLVIGLLFLTLGKQTAEQIKVVPQQTVETLKEHAPWIDEEATSNRP